MMKRGKAEKKAARQARLSAALRENLKRRKQQARQRQLAGKGAANVAIPSPDAPAAEGAPDFRRNQKDD